MCGWKPQWTVRRPVSDSFCHQWVYILSQLHYPLWVSESPGRQWGAGLLSDATSVYWAPYRSTASKSSHRHLFLQPPPWGPFLHGLQLFVGGWNCWRLASGYNKDLCILIWGFSDRTWDSYLCSPGHTIQKRRDLTLMGPPKTDGAKEPLVHKMSSEAYSISYSERSLEWTPFAHGRSQLDNALGQAPPLSVSTPSHTTAPWDHSPSTLLAWRLFFMTCSGSRLRQTPAL